MRAAYSSRSQDYIDLFDGEGDAHEVDAAFSRRRLGAIEAACAGQGPVPRVRRGLAGGATGIDMIPDWFTSAAGARAPG